MAKYGFNSIVRTPSLSNNFVALGLRSSESILKAVRVKYIMLDNSDATKFEKYGGWNGLGVIEYEIISNAGGTQTSVAYPLDPNTKNLPLLEEIVYIISLPDTSIGSNPLSTRNYYIKNIGLWNHPHHNAYPTNPTNLPPSQQKDYVQTQLGSVRRVTDQSTEINLGKTFIERSNIHPLLPFEGDVIYEGRWGNSIRLGSTVNNSFIPNSWSNTGENGDPLIIIRNGQGLQTNEGWVPITEDINNDESSIYLTSNQKIPISVPRTDYTSYSSNPPTLPDQYSGTQILLNSGRLVFSSYEDHILLSSNKSINLNSQESVNIDTKKFVTQADKIFLGKEELATEPLLKGNTTVNLLRNLIEALETLSIALKTAQTSPTIPGTPANLFSVNLAAVTLSTSLKTLKTQLNTLTSERNFTL